jgi:DoxX-like protein
VSIYVEILVRAPMDELWAHTQTPSLHQRWDARFSEIEYLPKALETAPQRFRYTTRIGFGFDVSGEGETIGERSLADGSRSSSLRFGSAQPSALIREGSGYWKYIPTADGIRFLTWYDYRTRFGAAGALFDRWIFRPLLGWATAWSFDRLRLWLEKRIRPEDALRQLLVHTVSRVALAAIFVYQGLVPKLLARNVDELVLLNAAGVPDSFTRSVVSGLGILELTFAFLLLARWRERWPGVVAGIAVVIATAVVGLYSRRFFLAAFNPLSLNLAVASLAAVDFLSLADLPSAARCRRSPREDA